MNNRFQHSSPWCRCLPFAAGLLLLTLAPVAALHAQASSEPLAIELSVFKLVVDPAGNPSFSPAQDASPGDVLSYQAEFTNRSSGDLRQVRPFVPIPDPMAFVEDSDLPPGALWVLSDGVELLASAAREHLAAAVATGTPLRVTGLRWGPLDLPPGASFRTSLRASIPTS